jgi:hypothetical protein
MNTVPASLRGYRADLVAAIDCELEHARPARLRRERRRPWHARRDVLLAGGGAAVVVVALLVLTIVAPWQGSPTILDRAEAALLAPASGQILYERVTIHPIASSSPGTATRVHLWLDSAPPHRFRMTFSGSRPAEVGGTLGSSTGLNYVASDDALYRAAFQFRVGELDLDPAAFIRTALSSGRAKLDGRTTIRGRNVIRIQLSTRFDGRLVSIALYYVDPKTYRPVRLVFPSPHGRVAILSAASWSKNLGKRFPRGTLVVLADPSTWSRLGFPMHPSMFLLGFPGYTVPTLFIPGATVSGPRPHLVFDFEEYRLLAPTADNRKLTSVRAMHPRAEKP